MMKVEVSGEPLRPLPYLQELKHYELNRRLFRREFRQLRMEFSGSRGWIQALRFYRVFRESAGVYHIGLPTMYLPEELPAKKKYGKYLICETRFPTFEQAISVAEEVKKSLARPEKNHGQTRKSGHGLQDGGAICPELPGSPFNPGRE